jgi:signal transduction histidine kinase
VTDNRVRALLLCTILVVTVLPLAAAFYFLDRALQTSLDLGFNRQVVGVLDTASENLRTLRDLDPANRAEYRQEFESVEALKQVYAQPELVKSSLLDSLKIYFGIGLLAAVFLAVIVAALLSRRIANSYAQNFAELTAHREKVRYLQEMSSWQELARVLAHEIKNPLTPIEVLVSSLARSYLSKPSQEFQEQLTQTQTMIGEELGHLKRTVNRFSEFAKLPQVQLVAESPRALLEQHVKALVAHFDAARFELDVSGCAPEPRANIDSTLFRQVLMNIARNGVEANPGRAVRFDIVVSCEPHSVRITIHNDGVPVPAEIAGRIFDPYVSSKSGKDNMGLGLAIVKKIVIEHGGEIAYDDAGGHPRFTISLPRVTG